MERCVSGSGAADTHGKTGGMAHWHNRIQSMKTQMLPYACVQQVTAAINGHIPCTADRSACR
jgi:hypothetical protein